MDSVDPTNRPMSVLNRYIIEGFGGVLVLSISFFNFVFVKRGFVIRLSQISFFSLLLA